MANNLFIAYDLDSPGQNYAKVEAKIISLGAATKVQMSLYYLKTTLSAQDVEANVWSAMDANDRLIVIDASDAWWHNPLGQSQGFIQSQWKR